MWRTHRGTPSPPQSSENFTQADLPRSNNAQCQDTTEGPIGNLGEGTNQCNQTNHPAQVPTEAPLHIARTPQAIDNYRLGARLPGSFTGGAEPIEDSPLTKRNTPTTKNLGGNTPAREISSAVIGLTALEAMQAISDCPASAVPMSRDQALAKIQRYLLKIEQQWLEYDEGGMGYTPGNDRYIELAMRCYSQRIDKQVGKEPDGPLGPKVKVMNLPKPEKYVGKDDIDKFDKWLVQLLAYFQIFKITGPCTDATCIQYTGLYLSKLAQQWYSQEVLASTRHI